jgi:hypothetical protein
LTETAGQGPGAVDQAAIDRADARARALEAAIAAAAVAVIAARVARIVADLRDAFTQWATSSPARWATARVYVSAQMRSIPVRLTEALTPQLWRAAELGARQAGAVLPGGYDPATQYRVREMLDGIDTAVTARIRAAARAVDTGRIDTPARLAQVTAKVDAVASTARARVEDTVARAVADGAHAAMYGAPTPATQPPEEPVGGGDQPSQDATAAPGTDLVWWSERRACLACTSLAGSTPGPDGLCRPVLQVSARVSPYIAAGVIPPAHPNCRCRLVPATPGLADALLREGQREVAYGWSQYDSLRSRLRAADLLVRAGGSRLPKTVVGRARTAVQEGRFEQPLPPR